MLLEEKVLDTFDAIKCWKRGDQRAPHKPLLLLMALAQLQRNEARWLKFNEIEKKLSLLLVQFGTKRGNLNPHYPFWRLREDRIWEVSNTQKINQNLTSSGDARISVLREVNAQGGFPQELSNFLSKRPNIIDTIVANILNNTFPASRHEELLDAVGFPWLVKSKIKRDPRFRENILRIYEQRCAICGYDGQLGNTTLGIEAAHIKWHAAGGPDHMENGIALCVFHHKAFDRGAISIRDDLRLLISQDVRGRQDHLDQLLLKYIDSPIQRPQSGNPTPNQSFLAWHRKEVFQHPARISA